MQGLFTEAYTGEAAQKLDLHTIESLKADIHEKAVAGEDDGSAALELVGSLVENR